MRSFRRIISSSIPAERGGGQLLLFRGALTDSLLKETTMQNSEITALVDRSFNSALDRKHRVRTNPITGSRFVPGLDSESEQRQLACKLIEADLYFRDLNILGLPQFPWGMAEREALKGTNLLHHIVALYARSLEYCGYDLSSHPPFPDYISGVLSEQSLSKRLSAMYSGQTVPFQPNALPGLDASGYFNPKGHNVHALRLTSHGTAKP